LVLASQSPVSYGLAACCYLQDNTVVTFLTTIHTVYSGKRADLEAKYGTRWHVATRKRPSADGSSVREQVLQPPAQRFYNYYYDGECCLLRFPRPAPTISTRPQCIVQSLCNQCTPHLV
jgi:hypothetical protein